VAELKTTTKKAQCIACDRTIAIGMYAHQSKATCDDCAADRCETCGDPTGTMRRIGVHRARFCEPCRAIWREEYDMKHAKENGRKGGLISTANSSKRSKNEMHFAELCEETFDNVSTNDACFTDKNGNNWDADVVLHDHLVAVMWNGVFHYKQIHKSQSLKQVKARDKIKKSVIKDNGYLVYVIKDMGKEDPAFVLAQFAIFLDHINSL
jgi:ribosomal protein S14